MNLKHSFKVQIVTGILLCLNFSCDQSKQTAGSQKSGQSEAANTVENSNPADTSKPGDATAKSTSKTTKSTAEATVKLTDSEIIAKMSFEAFFNNVSTGKLFTGFTPGTTFLFESALVVVVDGIIPEDIEKTLSDDDFDRIYSTAEFKKKAFDFKSKLTLTVDPAYFSMMELAAADVSDDPMDPTRVFFVKSNKAGSTSIDLTLNGKKTSIAATIAAYTAQQLNDGLARYNTAVAGATPSPSCQSCHGVAGGANHSPTYLAQFTDAAMLSTIETGKNSDDGYMTKVAHKMTFSTPAQKAGIVAYLRSLPAAP